MEIGVVTFGAKSWAGWRQKALAYDAAGFDYLFLPDHVGVFNPVTAAASAGGGHNASARRHARVERGVLESAAAGATRRRSVASSLSHRCADPGHPALATLAPGPARGRTSVAPSSAPHLAHACRLVTPPPHSQWTKTRGGPLLA
jgi:hypothetical protein